MTHLDRRPRARRAALIVLLVGTVVLSSCKVSPTEYHSYTDTGGTVRCTAGQSYAGETADQDPSGLVPAGGSTAAKRDGYCSTDDALSPGWTYLDVRIFLYKVRADGSGYFPCASTETLSTTSAREIADSVKGRSGAGDYFVRGLHGHVRTGSTLYRYESFTDFAYNT